MKKISNLLLIWHSTAQRASEHPAGAVKFMRHAYAANAEAGVVVIDVEIDQEGAKGVPVNADAGKLFAEQGLRVSFPVSVTEAQRLAVDEATHEILGGIAAAADLSVALEQMRDKLYLVSARALFDAPDFDWPKDEAPRRAAFEAVGKAIQSGVVADVAPVRSVDRAYSILIERQNRADFMGWWKVILKPSHPSWKDLSEMALGHHLDQLINLVQTARDEAGALPKA